MSMYTFIELIWAEFWEDFPELKFSLTEGDVGWIPYFLWRAEHVLNRHSGWTEAKFPKGYGGPTDVFKQHLYTCFISDKVGVQNMDWFNEDMLCWESDFPHSDSNWPFAPEDVIETLGHLDDAADQQDHPRERHGRILFRPVRAHPQGACAGRLPQGAGGRRRRRHPRRPRGQPTRPRRLGADDLLRTGQDGRGRRNRQRAAWQLLRA